MKDKCYIEQFLTTTACRGKVKRRFTGEDEAVLCDKHWKELKTEGYNILT